MYAKQRGVEKVVKKGSTRKRKNLSDSKKPECGNEEDDDKNKPITDASTSSRKRKDLSESKKPDCGNEKEDNKNKSVADAFKSQSVNEKQGGKRVGRKRKNDVKVSENEKKTKVSSEYFSCIKESTSESVDTTIESTKNDLPGMSLRRSRKTRQSGSSMSDRETDVIITTPVDPLKLEDGGRNSKEQKKEKEREEQVEKFPILSAKEPEIKKTKSIQNANEGKQTNLYEDIVNETQSVVENSRKMKRGKNAAIKESSSKEKSKEGDERPMTRHSTRSSQRTLSKRSESISSGSERDFKSLEIPLMDTVSQEAQQLPKTLNQKLKENTDQTENISLEQDTDIELQQNISNKGLEVTVVRKVEIQKSNPILPTTIRKRGRKKIKVDDLVPSADKKTAVKSGLDTESLNVGDEVLNKRKGKNRRNLACVPKKMENSISEGNEKTVTDFSIHAEMKNEHKKKSASNDSLSTDSRNTIAMEEESEKTSSDTTNMDGISKLSHFISKDNNASISEEKGSQGKKDKVMVVRGRRGRKKLNQSRGRKFGYKAKNSGQVHLASDSEDNGIASKDTGTLEVLNQASIAPLFKSKTSRKRMSPPHSNEELGREKLLKSSGMVQRVDSMLCAVPSSENIPLKGDEISESSDFELCLNKPDTAHQRKNQKTNLNKELRSKRTKEDLEKDELGNFDYSSSNVDSNDKCDKDVRRRVFKGKKRRGGVFKQKSRKIRLSSVHLAKGKVEQTKKVSYLERMKRTFSLKDLSIVVEKLDINNPQILKSMSYIFPTNESTGNMEEKTKGIQKERIDITAVDSMVPSTQTSKPADKSLEKEAIVHANTKNIEETTFLDTEKLDELIENQIPNLEVSVHTENALAHCDDQESKNTQTDCFEKLSDNLITSSCEKLCHTNDSEKLPVEIKNVPDFSICNREEILDMDQDKSANILESENFNPSERGILEKQKKLESVSNSLDSDTTSTCDENKLDAEISMNPLEKTTDNKNDLLLDQPISTNKNKTSSESLEYSCDSSRTSIGEEDKTSNSTEINLNVSKTKSDSKSLIGSEDVFIVMNSSECSEDSMHSKTVLLSVKQDKMKECYVNMSEAIDICNTYECKKKASKKTNTESKICFNSTVSPAQNNPIDIKNSTKDTNANEAVHEGQENSEKELVVNTAIEEVAEVTDSGLEDEIVAALEDSIEVNDELEVREVYNAAIKDMKEITGCGLDELAAQDVDREITEVELGSKNDDVLEVQSKAVQKEQPLIQSDMTIKDGKEIKINESKSRKEAAYDVIKDESGSAFEKDIDTLEEVSEKALEETVESSTNIDKIHDLKSGKEVVYDVIESGSAFEKEIDTLEEVREKALEETVESGTNIDKINELRSGKEVGFDAIEDESGSAFEKKIDTLEEVSEKALEETVESGTNIDKINELKSGKEVGYDVMEDESGNGFVKGIGTLEEVSEKAPEETIESDTNIDKINELKSGKEVGYDVMEDESGNGFVKGIDTVEVSEKAPEETIESDTCLEEQTKSDAALEQVDCVKEQDKSNAVLKLCKTKCDVPLHKDEKNVDNDKNLEDLKQDVRDINLEHKRELKCGTTKKERETALQGRTEVDLDTALQNQQKNKKNETHQELQQARTHETSKAQLKPKYTAKFILQRFSGNTETKERDQDKADESRNETCAILEHQSKVKKEAFRDKISEPVCESDNRNENALDFTESNMFNRMQKYFNMESPPSNFLSAIKSDMKLLHSEPNSQGIDFNEDDCNKYFVDAGKKDPCVESSLKLNKSKILESPKVPIEQNSDNFESNQSKPGSSNATTDKTAKKRKIEEAEPKTYYWPKFSNQLAWEYLQPFVPVLHTALDSILENNPRDPIQYFSQWLNDHKAEAYFMMASIPLAPEFKLKKPKR